ncbi:MAG: HD domain-containing protein [Lachnospiraceae bacterium]|nr:HD domain-containing protein [Lachnospiraceae bacterium]MEE1351816.1 HD domain-containing protein [Clostridia bacterium]
MSKKEKEKRLKDKEKKSKEKQENLRQDMERFPLFSKIVKNKAARIYIECQNKALKALGYTEHGFAHVKIVANRTRYILETLGEEDHTIDLALTAAWLHDIGNIVNRVDHSQSGALMAFQILNEMHVPPEDIAPIICAIGNHDEGNGVPVNRISAALILADKSDVRRSRVQQEHQDQFDIHDRVNYSATGTEIKINKDHSGIKLKMHVDTRYGEIGEYFEIFMDRMLLCKRAANSLGLNFHLIINEMSLM